MMKKQNGTGKFVLKMRGNDGYLKYAGYTEDAEGKSYPGTVSTKNIDKAQRFPTYRQAERMRRTLTTQYGVASMIMEV